MWIVYIVYSVETYGKCVENVWKMGQGVWNISTVIYFAK